MEAIPRVRVSLSETSDTMAERTPTLARDTPLKIRAKTKKAKDVPLAAHRRHEVKPIIWKGSGGKNDLHSIHQQPRKRLQGFDNRNKAKYILLTVTHDNETYMEG